MDLTNFGKYFVFFGVVLLFIGGVLLVLGKAGIGIGKLPGDILIKKENFTFYFPLATCIIISVILTILLALFNKK